MTNFELFFTRVYKKKRSKFGYFHIQKRVGRVQLGTIYPLSLIICTSSELSKIFWSKDTVVSVFLSQSPCVGPSKSVFRSILLLTLMILQLFEVLEQIIKQQSFGQTRVKFIVSTTSAYLITLNTLPKVRACRIYRCLINAIEMPLNSSWLGIIRNVHMKDI